MKSRHAPGAVPSRLPFLRDAAVLGARRTPGPVGAQQELRLEKHLSAVLRRNIGSSAVRAVLVLFAEDQPSAQEQVLPALQLPPAQPSLAPATMAETQPPGSRERAALVSLYQRCLACWRSEAAGAGAPVSSVELADDLGAAMRAFVAACWWAWTGSEGARWPHPNDPVSPGWIRLASLASGW